ncbi:S9 family peptidase [Shewanella sp. N2AIL]|uniref:S9 family peptidase n=1 Tax=Shewanella TaxID=22 RepID=UPI000D368ECE|nr:MULTISPECIES: S9 family peptidase [Shewanella]MCI2962431.1 S9 family peptidase [Shewanella sp. N2AIL]
MRSLLLTLGIAMLLSGCSTSKGQVPAPVAEKIPHVMTLHGVTRTDDYYWLRDDERKDPKVLAHLEAENRYTAAYFKPLKPLQDGLFKELTERLVADESSVPYQWHQHSYYSRYKEGGEYPLISRKGVDGVEQVMLDVNERAKGHEFYGLGGASVSPDETMLAFGEDVLSRRVYHIYFKDLASGDMIVDVLENTEGRVVWANDNKHVFYIAKDLQTLLGYQVYRHELGTKQSSDVLVYEEQDDSFYISLGKTLDESQIVLFQESTTTSEVSVLDASEPLGLFKPVLAREEGHEYSVSKLGDTYYILTNWQATNFRLMKVAIKDAADKSKWQEVVAHNPNARIEDELVLKDYLIIQTRENGLTRIKVMPFNGQKPFELSFDEPAYVMGLDVNAQQDSNKLRIFYSSLTTPEAVYEYSLVNPDRRDLLKQDQVLGGFDASQYRAERVFITARDGAKVPVSLVYRKDKFKKDGTNPLYQYGYGSYGYTVEPDFSSSVISLLDRGFVYAIAHVRGSEMLGRPWYDDGKLLNKQNTFNDFIDVTTALTAQGYGDKNKVVASGGSAGGLLMGAIANQAPDKYFAIAAHVPFVDVVTTMLDESIPLTTNEYDEWGNPNEKTYFDYMLSYSPYDNVTEQEYPHMLVTTGLHDSQVQYFEPAKWVAKLRDVQNKWYKMDDKVLLFNVDMEAGHGGKSGRYRQYQDTAQEYAFFLSLLGMAK